MASMFPLHLENQTNINKQYIAVLMLVFDLQQKGLTFKWTSLDLDGTGMAKALL